jgi:hypothetical protein
MKFTMFVPALAAMSIALTIPTLAEAGCDGLKGKDKKACIKKEKANAGSTPYTPSQLGAAFTAWDEEGKNPFAMEAYSVRSNESGFADVDAYLGKIWRIQAVVAGARYTVDQVAAGDAEVSTSSAEPCLTASLPMASAWDALTRTKRPVSSWTV